MKTIYKDSCGSYSITVNYDGTAILKCSNVYGKRWYNKEYKTENGAKIALSRLCGGMPTRLK